MNGRSESRARGRARGVAGVLALVCAGLTACRSQSRGAPSEPASADYAVALDELTPLAARGDGDAQLLLGLMHQDGAGVAQDHAEAARWYRRAADQGVAQAQYALGVLSERGGGVPRSDEIGRAHV